MEKERIWQLLAKKYNNTLTEQEREELSFLLQAHPEALFTLECMEDLRSNPVQPIVSDVDEEKNWEKISAAIHTKQPLQQQTYGKSLMLLTSIIILACTIWGIYYVSLPEGITTHLKEPALEVVVTDEQKKIVQLPDGSTARINAGSSINYSKDFGVQKREIMLEGEAYFEIVSNEKMPLIVRAGEIEIKVKGTSFNVRAYAKDSVIEAALISGVIEVFIPGENRGFTMKPNEKITIDKLNLNRTAQPSTQDERVMVLEKINGSIEEKNIVEVAWINESLYFNKESFSSLAKKMERWFGVSVHFDDEKLKSLSFTGSFEKENIEEALEALSLTSTFSYRIKGKEVFIYSQQKLN